MLTNTHHVERVSDYFSWYYLLLLRFSCFLRKTIKWQLSSKPAVETIVDTTQQSTTFLIGENNESSGTYNFIRSLNLILSLHLFQCEESQVLDNFIIMYKMLCGYKINTSPVKVQNYTKLNSEVKILRCLQYSPIHWFGLGPSTDEFVLYIWC